MKKTKAEYEKYLNRLISETMTEEMIFQQYVYLTTKNRVGGTVSKVRFNHAIWRSEMGSLLRWHDPIAFKVGYNEWKLKK